MDEWGCTVMKPILIFLCLHQNSLVFICPSSHAKTATLGIVFTLSDGVRRSIYILEIQISNSHLRVIGPNQRCAFRLRKRLFVQTEAHELEFRRVPKFLHAAVITFDSFFLRFLRQFVSTGGKRSFCAKSRIGVWIMGGWVLGKIYADKSWIQNLWVVTSTSSFFFFAMVYQWEICSGAALSFYKSILAKKQKRIVKRTSPNLLSEWIPGRWRWKSEHHLYEDFAFVK